MRNKEIYERCGMRERARGVTCGVAEWVQRSTFRWYGHMRRIMEETMAKGVYQSATVGSWERGGPHMSWEGKVDRKSEYRWRSKRVEEGKQAFDTRKISLPCLTL